MRKMTKSDFFGSLFFSSHILKGTFASIFVGICSFFGHFRVIHTTNLPIILLNSNHDN